MPEYMTVDELAAKLNISRRWAMDLLRKGQGPEHYKFGRKIMIKRVDFESWKETCKVPKEK